VHYLEENVVAVEVELSDDDLARLDELAPVAATAGDRYADTSSIDS
jgi:aryl-alcohol dehydrogenase-like predicted oxidoreductase